MKEGSRALVEALIASLIPAVTWGGPVNLNTADASALAKELDGIGPAKAQAIGEYRQKNGPFLSAEHLRKVDGIGDKGLEQNRGNIRLNGGTAAPAPAAKPAPKGAKPASPSATR